MVQRDTHRNRRLVADTECSRSPCHRSEFKVAESARRLQQAFSQPGCHCSYAAKSVQSAPGSSSMYIRPDNATIALKVGDTIFSRSGCPPAAPGSMWRNAGKAGLCKDSDLSPESLGSNGGCSGISNLFKESNNSLIYCFTISIESAVTTTTVDIVR